MANKTIRDLPQALSINDADAQEISQLGIGGRHTTKLQEKTYFQQGMATLDDARFPTVDQKKALDYSPHTLTATNPVASMADVQAVTTEVKESNIASVDQTFGNDTTGVVGDLSKPFKTYNNATAKIYSLTPAPSSTNTFIVYYSAGEHSETNIVLQPFVSISGANTIATRLNVEGSISAGDGFMTHSAIVCLQNIYSAGAPLALDMRDIGGTTGIGAAFIINDCYWNGLVYLAGRVNAGSGNNSLDTFSFCSTALTGDITVDGGNLTMIDCPEKTGYLTINATVANTNSDIKNCLIPAVILNGSTSGVTNKARITNCSITGTIMLKGVNAFLTIDAASAPTGGFTFESGATIEQITFLNSSDNTINLSDVSGEMVTDALNTLGTAKENVSNKGQANGYVPLGADSKIPSTYIPPLAITETYIVASQAAMLALSAQIGDVAVRTDVNKSYILKAADPSILANWVELLTPAAPVQSVNAYTGNVTLTKSDVGLANVVNLNTSTTANITDSTNKRFLTDAALSAINSAISVNGMLKGNGSGGFTAATPGVEYVTPSGLGSYVPTAGGIMTGDLTVPNLVLGSGDASSAPVSGKIRGPAATGNSIAGVDTYIDASNGTGAGGSGKLIFRTAAPISSSPTINGYTAASNSNIQTLTFSHDGKSGTNRVLVIQVVLSYSGVSVTSITYAGTSATLLSAVTGSSSRIETWYIVAPSTGINNVVVNLSNYAGICIEAINLTSVNQTTPFGTVATVNSFGTSASIAAPSSTGQIVLDLISSSAGAPTITGGQTAVWSNSTGTGVYGAGSTKAASATSTTMSYSFTNGNYIGMAFAVQYVANTMPNVLTPALTLNNDGTIALPGLSGAGIVKANASGTFVAATAGTDYLAPTTGTGSWVSQALTLTGPITSTTLTIYFKPMGDIIYVVIPDITVNGNGATTSFVSSTAAIPAEYRPAGAYNSAHHTLYTGAGIGTIEINSAGYFKIFYQDKSSFPAFTTTGLRLFLGRQASFFYSKSF